MLDLTPRPVTREQQDLIAGLIKSNTPVSEWGLQVAPENIIHTMEAMTLLLTSCDQTLHTIKVAEEELNVRITQASYQNVTDPARAFSEEAAELYRKRKRTLGFKHRVLVYYRQVKLLRTSYYNGSTVAQLRQDRHTLMMRCKDLEQCVLVAATTLVDTNPELAGSLLGVLKQDVTLKFDGTAGKEDGEQNGKDN